MHHHHHDEIPEKLPVPSRIRQRGNSIIHDDDDDDDEKLYEPRLKMYDSQSSKYRPQFRRAKRPDVKEEPIKAEDILPKYKSFADESDKASLYDDELKFEPSLFMLDSHTAMAAMSHVPLPYSNDLAKQNRYRHYLESLGTIDGSIIPRAELAEFYRAAMIFRPMEGDMAQRFTVAQNIELDDSQILTPAQTAAINGEYGPKTLSVTKFEPSDRLCILLGLPLHAKSQ